MTFPTAATITAALAVIPAAVAAVVSSVNAIGTGYPAWELQR